MKQKLFKVVDVFNGWASAPAPLAEAEAQARRENEVVPATAEWRYDHRDGQWAWFYNGERIS